jgi:ATP-dependent DNA helicase RecG
MEIQLTLSFEKILPILSPDDIYSSLEPELLAGLKEDRRIERKPANTHPRALGDYFSMWANTPPEGGLIFLGVEDDGSISGCNCLSERELNEREKANRTFAPDARSESRRVQATNRDGEVDFILAIRVFYREDKVVTTVSGDAFIRDGDSKRKLSPDEIREFQNDKGQVDLEREPASLSFPNDFDADLLRQFCDGVRKLRQLNAEHTREEILVHRRLGKVDGGRFVPNVACALAFASDPGSEFPGCKVRFLRFNGEREETGTDYNVVKDITVEGPVPRLITDTASILRQQLREFSHFGKDGKFYTLPEYPEEAWYEVIVNACVHRSYGLRNMNIMVKMFDDRLVVESPGGFPPFVTPENIYTAHHPRNPKLMDAMFYLDFVKCHNEGTRRIRDAMAKMDLPAPEFAQKEIHTGFTAVRVTLRNSAKQRVEWIDADVGEIIGEDIARSLSDVERRVVNFVAEQGQINVSDCFRIVPNIKTWHAAKKVLTRLVDKGVLTDERDPAIKRDPHAHFKLKRLGK